MQVFRQRLLDRIDRYQQFLKRDLLDHLEPHSPVAAHCLCRLLGGQEAGYKCSDCTSKKTCNPCKDRAWYSTDCPASCGNHAQHCELCDLRFVIFADMRQLLDLLKPCSVNTAKLEDLAFKTNRWEMARCLSARLTPVPTHCLPL